jgi:hypothetical protein
VAATNIYVETARETKTGKTEKILARRNGNGDEE